MVTLSPTTVYLPDPTTIPAGRVHVIRNNRQVVVNVQFGSTLIKALPANATTGTAGQAFFFVSTGSQWRVFGALTGGQAVTVLKRTSSGGYGLDAGYATGSSYGSLADNFPPDSYGNDGDFLFVNLSDTGLYFYGPKNSTGSSPYWGTGMILSTPDIVVTGDVTGTLSTTSSSSGVSAGGALSLASPVSIAKLPTGTTSSTVALGNHSHLQTGTWGARPRANTVNAGTQYYATDLDVMFVSDGTKWYRFNSQPAEITALHRLSAPSGWIACDGTQYTITTSNSITAVAASTPASGSARYTTTTAHGLSVGSKVVIGGFTPTGYNGLFTVVTVPSSTQFTVSNSTTTAVSTYGSISLNTASVGTQSLYYQYFNAIASIAVGTFNQSSGTSGTFTSVSNTAMTDSAQTKFVTQLGSAGSASISGFVYTQYAYSAVAASGTITATSLPLIGNWMDIATGTVLSSGDAKYPVVGDDYVLSQWGGPYQWGFKSLNLGAGQTVYGAVSGNTVSSTADSITASVAYNASATAALASNEVRGLLNNAQRYSGYSPDTTSGTVTNRLSDKYTITATSDGGGRQSGTGLNWYARL
jgi:hypothetical protein